MNRVSARVDVSIPRTTTAERMRQREQAVTQPIPRQTLAELAAEWREQMRATAQTGTP